MAKEKSDDKDGCLGCLGMVMVVAIIAVVIGGCHACGRSNNSSDSTPETHLTKKQKAEKAEKQSIKKAQLRNEKEHLGQLRNALSKLPDRSKNAITSAKLDKSNMYVTLTLNDAALEGNDVQVRKLTKEAWEIGVGTVRKYAPYPDSDISGDAPAVYVEDGAENELGRSTALGDFKWEG